MNIFGESQTFLAKEGTTLKTRTFFQHIKNLYKIQILFEKQKKKSYLSTYFQNANIL